MFLMPPANRFWDRRAKHGKATCSLFQGKRIQTGCSIRAAWPKGMDFVTFSCYYVETASALSVISSFCETIQAVFVMAEVEILADEWREDRFDLTNLSHQEVLDLWRGTRAKLDGNWRLINGCQVK